ncbi:MAG: hypothetical protein AAB771_01460 [Patescibacteria group bacterium]
MNKQGLTLLEITVVLGILLLIFAMGTPVALDFYLNYQLSSEQRILISVLKKARNLALVNYNESNHGVYLNSAAFTLFQGNNYLSRDASRDQNFPRAQVVSISGLTEFVFEALSGRTSSSTLTLTDGRKNKFIYINEEGGINF